MNNPRFWETTNDQITISLCPEGCIHLMVGRAIIKMTQEEFFSLAKLTNKAAREIQFPGPIQTSVPGH